MSTQSGPYPTTGNETADARPKLLFFFARSDGRSRRVEGYLAQVLQRRRNQDTFQLYRIDCDARVDLVHRCGIDEPPALVVVENTRVLARVEQPRGCGEIEKALAAWLR